MKYKFTREKLAKLYFDYEDKCDFLEDLLAQKEYKKECIHEGDKTDWHPQFCRKCGTEFMYDFSTSSPPEEIEKVKFGMDSNQTFENFYDKINEIIRTVNKLIKN